MRERLLAVHFLRRFIDNDLISPHADRHQVFAVVAASLATSGLFVTVLVTLKFQFLLQPPGVTAVLALDDRFVYIASSMIVMALVAVAIWDALGLDARDAAILGHLPLQRRVLVRAKVAAVILFASGFALALNAVPSLAYPAFMIAKLPAGPVAVLGLMAAHAVATMAAGAFGFLAVWAMREILYAVLTRDWFRRISLLVQASLVVVLTTTLLLLPGMSLGVVPAWLAPRTSAMYTIPPLWFLGLHETLAGHVIDRLPREDLRGPLLAADRTSTQVYRGLRPAFVDLARMAIVSLAAAGGLAIACCAWNSRRPPHGAIGHRRSRRLMAPVQWIAGRALVRDPVARAGFFFTLHSLSRSAPHRLTMATAAAAGLAAAALGLRSAEIGRIPDVASVPVAWLAAQTAILTALIVGVRHAMRVPAQLSANWMFHVAWAGDERPYLSGVKRAAICGIVLPALVALYPLHAWVLGGRLAAAHALYGFLIGLVLLQALLLRFNKLPFASSYQPAENLKALAPIYLLLFIVGTYAVGVTERFALSQPGRTMVACALLAAVVAGLSAIDRIQRRTRVPIELDEVPAPPTQRLDLSER